MPRRIEIDGLAKLQKFYALEAWLRSMMEADVYKQHDISAIESTAEDVDLCQYSEGLPLVRYGSVKTWKPSHEEILIYTRFKVASTFCPSYFVCDARDLVVQLTSMVPPKKSDPGCFKCTQILADWFH